MRFWISVWVTVCCGFWGCGHAKPGTHVEVLDEAGDNIYVGGAAASGTNKSIACRAAVQRSVDAVSLKFVDENDDVADDVADAVGVSDGRPVLRRYARQKALDAAVQDVRFDPSNHICMATIRWKPPIFVKEAVIKAAQEIKRRELGGGEASAARAKTAPATVPAQGASPPPPLATSVAPKAASATPPKAASQCQKDRRAFARTVKKGRGALDDFNECKRRTQGDEQVCHRYKLYVEEAEKNDAAAAGALARCLNAALPTALLRAVEQELPQHAAVPVESRGDGTRILWTLSPLDQTAFALEVSLQGSVVQRTPLAANQVAWMREQLGL